MHNLYLGQSKLLFTNIKFIYLILKGIKWEGMGRQKECKYSYKKIDL